MEKKKVTIEVLGILEHVLPEKTMDLLHNLSFVATVAQVAMYLSNDLLVLKGDTTVGDWKYLTLDNTQYHTVAFIQDERSLRQTLNNLEKVVKVLNGTNTLQRDIDDLMKVITLDHKELGVPFYQDVDKLQDLVTARLQGKGELSNWGFYC
jgi:hypothetical protein